MASFKSRALVTILLTTPIALTLFIYKQESSSSYKPLPLKKVEAVAKVVQDMPASALIAKHRGDLEMAQGKVEMALTTYLSGLQHHPDPLLEAKLLLRIGTCYQLQGSGELASKAYLDGLELSKNDGRLTAHLLTAMGNLHREKGHYDKAVAAYREASLCESGLPSLQASLQATIGKSLYQLGSYEQAIETLEKAIALGVIGETNYTLGRALLASGQYRQAAVQFKLGLQEKESEKLCRIMLPKALAALSEEIMHIGEDALASGDRESAKAAFEEALSLESAQNESALHAHLGDLAGSDRASMEKAETHYRAALAAGSKEERLIGTIHLNLAHLLLQKEKFEEAQSHYEMALSHLETTSELYRTAFTENNELSITYANKLLDQGELLGSSGKLTEALALFTKASKIDGLPEQLTAFIRLRLGETLISQGNYTKALPELEGALTLAPEDSAFKQRATFLMGIALSHLGQFDRASLLYNESLDLSKGDNAQEEEIKTHIASLSESRLSYLIKSGTNLLKAGNSLEAFETFKQGLNLKSKNPLIEAKLNHGAGSALIHLGRYDKAQHYFLNGLALKFEQSDLRASLHHKLGMTFEKNGNMIRAQREFAKALALKPTEPMLAALIEKSLASLCSADGDKIAALNHLKSALGYDFTNPSIRAKIHQQMALIYMDSGAQLQAAIQLKHALKQPFSDDVLRATLLIELASILATDNQEAAARDLYKQASKLKISRDMQNQIKEAYELLENGESK